MKRILVLGSGGRLGAALAESYAEGFEVIGLTRQDLDLRNSAEVRKQLGDLDFDVAINCAALTNVDYCETHREEAFAINGDAVQVIAQACQKQSARLIHISTDYVFDGERRDGYSESSIAEPISVYGESKLKGEGCALEISEDNLVVRVSWVFGPHRPSFIEMMLKRTATDEAVAAIGDKYSAPSYTLDLAEMLRPYLAEISTGGVLHLSNDGSCSWQEYAQHAIDTALEIGLPLKAHRVDSIEMDSLTAFVARRPRHTVMLTNRFTNETGRNPRPWREAVADYVRRFGRAIIFPDGLTGN